MEVWQIDLLKYGVTAIASGVIAGVGGWWAHWKWTREERLKAELREKERQGEYDEFKKKRKLIGAGEVEKMERADKLTDLLIKQKTHQITPDEFATFKEKLIAGHKRPSKIAARRSTINPFAAAVERARAKKSGKLLTVEEFLKLAPFDERLTEEQQETIAVKLLSFLKEMGPNRFPVGYDDEGNKVEWIRDDDEAGEGNESYRPMILLRPEEEIHAATEECFEKVWWYRHEAMKQIIDAPLPDGSSDLMKRAAETQKPDPQLWAIATAFAKKVEEKYGRDQLELNDFQCGLVNGKLSALRWVTGVEWDFLDT